MKLWIEIFQKRLARRDAQSMQTTTGISVGISVGLPRTGEAVQATLPHGRDSKPTKPNPPTNSLTTENSRKGHGTSHVGERNTIKNGLRRSVRNLWWPGAEKWAYLGDSWKQLWERVSEPGVRHVKLFNSLTLTRNGKHCSLWWDLDRLAMTIDW